MEMQLWQSRLYESWHGNDVKLYNLRERHWRIIKEYRDRYSIGSPAYVQTSNYLCKLREEMHEIILCMRYTQQLYFIGPIKGDMMAVYSKIDDDD